MAFRGKRLTPLGLKKDIDRLTNLFPKAQVIVRRVIISFSDIGEQIESAHTTLYEGEALVRPATGTVEGYGLGTVENLSLVILINGVHGFRQDDVVTINDGREYEVDFPPTHFNAFTVLHLAQRSQITRPT